MFRKKGAVVRTRKYGKLIRISAFTAAIAVAAGLIAYGWQQYEETKYPEGTEMDYSLPNAFIDFARLITDFINQNNEEEEPEIVSDEPEKEEEDRIIIVGSPEAESEIGSSGEEIEAEPEIRGGIVPEGEIAAYYDFRTSLFVGDYFVEQAENLGFFEYTNYAYVTGLDMNTMLTKKVMKTETENLTLADYVSSLDSIEAVYIMISAESVSWMDVPTFVKKYTVFVETIQKNHPEAHIYVQPVLPINEEKAEKRGYSVTNEKINQINEYIFEFAEEREIWILDMTEDFKNKEGFLPAEYTTNGIRFEKDTYQIWEDYIVSHKAH